MIKRPVTGVNPNSLHFDTAAFRCAGFRITPAFSVSDSSLNHRATSRDREASPGGCGHRNVAVTFRPRPWEFTIAGADRVAAYEVEAY
jgi:hypothetical protein